ncbi:hypothetical protein [Micromonospora eburnea]|uniref:Uncharacterized protein n=1 Tax=Micromonospora eburnea TaxID=227316 RepID=A0A1C6TZ01_9ACTN|nr:hypothetical protein [Micromonospora eburnea]SCL47035.1 hypothetical protein GA0070604_1405 [Micromonospora eburnea]
MTDEDPRRFDQLFTSDEPVKVPDWMRTPVQERELTRAERLRVGWARHSGKLLGLVGALVVVGVLAFLGTAGWRFVAKVNRGEVVLGGLAPTTAPRQVDADGNTLGVYLDTPAEQFAEGEAAIVLPPARATGPFTAKQVTTALTAVQAALIEGRLHPDRLATDPQPFLAMLAPDDRAAVRRDLAEGRNLGYATRILPNANPSWVPQDGIRARGTIEYKTTAEDGIRMLAVTTRFIWVYSFDLFQAQKHPPGTELVTVRDEVVWRFPHPDDVQKSSQGLWIQDADVTIAGAPCAALDQGYIALEYDPVDRIVARPGPASTADIYDSGWQPGDGEEC